MSKGYIYRSLQYALAFRKPSTARKLLYAQSAHHRLVWIHPFLDGKGRVSRLTLDTSIISSGVNGYGLKYVALTNSGMLGIAELPKGSANIFKHLLIYGESSRGSMAKVIGAKERTTTNVVQELLKRRFLASPSPKGPIRLKFTAHMGSYVFPDLLPIMPNNDIFVPKKRAGRPKLAH